MCIHIWIGRQCCTLVLSDVNDTRLQGNLSLFVLLPPQGLPLAQLAFTGACLARWNCTSHLNSQAESCIHWRVLYNNLIKTYYIRRHILILNFRLYDLIVFYETSLFLNNFISSPLQCCEMISDKTLQMLWWLQESQRSLSVFPPEAIRNPPSTGRKTKCELTTRMIESLWVMLPSVLIH